MRNNQYKIIFIDIDGTLVDDQKQIPQENIEVIKKLKEKGIISVLCSGRPAMEVRQFSKQSVATPYFIAAGGAIVQDFEKEIEIFKKEISKESAIKIVKIARKYQIYNVMALLKRIVVEKTKYKINAIGRKEETIVENLENVIKTSTEPILQFTLDNFNKEELEKPRKEITKISDIYVGPIDVFIEQEEKEKKVTYYFDIMPKNITKAEAIKQLLDYLKIDKSQAVGIGDGLNDLDMFDAVGYKIAMENGAVELKEKADEITLSNDKAGLAKALEKFL